MLYWIEEHRECAVGSLRANGLAWSYFLIGGRFEFPEHLSSGSLSLVDDEFRLHTVAT